MPRILILGASAGVVLVGGLVGGTSGGSSGTAVQRHASALAEPAQMAAATASGVASPPIVPGPAPVGPLPPAATPGQPTTPPLALSISVSQSLSSPGQDASAIQPTSCLATGDSITASGSLAGGTVPGPAQASGDVVELYVFSGPTAGSSVQLATLSSETPGSLSPTWTAEATVTGTFTSQLSASASCVVALQATHAPMATGNAGAAPPSPSPPPVPTPVPATPPTTSQGVITGQPVHVLPFATRPAAVSPPAHATPAVDGA